ncbi:hypothetical protein [Sphaerisporangium aureirubrum]|uniref:Uncharacterized protein n=1 Tax=Sphaerisporangium aureirubrum TaxID=1544736 RepID=A0ABW1NU56_9ACTN
MGEDDGRVAALLATLGGRLTSYIQDGDPGPLTDPDTRAETAELLRAAELPGTSGEIPVDVVRLVAVVYCVRYDAGGEPDDLLTAMLLLEPLSRMDPGLVPDEIRPLQARAFQDDAGGDDPGLADGLAALGAAALTGRRGSGTPNARVRRGRASAAEARVARRAPYRP